MKTSTKGTSSMETPKTNWPEVGEKAGQFLAACLPVLLVGSLVGGVVWFKKTTDRKRAEKQALISIETQLTNECMSSALVDSKEARVKIVASSPSTRTRMVRYWIEELGCSNGHFDTNDIMFLAQIKSPAGEGRAD